MTLVALGFVSGILFCLALKLAVDAIWPWPLVLDRKSRELMRKHR